MSQVRLTRHGVASAIVALGLATFATADHLDMLGMGILRGDLGSAAYDLNERGQMAGYSSGFEHGTSHAVLWDRTTGLRSLGTLPFAVHSEGRGLNDAAKVVGNSDYWPFVWTQSSGMQPLILPAGRSI